MYEIFATPYLPVYQHARRHIQKDETIYHGCYILLWRNSPTRAMTASFLRFLHHTKGHISVGRTPLDEGSACRRDLYLTTHNTDKRQTSMPASGFEIATPASDRPLTLASDRSATGICSWPVHGTESGQSKPIIYMCDHISLVICVYYVVSLTKSWATHGVSYAGSSTEEFLVFSKFSKLLPYSCFLLSFFSVWYNRNAPCERSSVSPHVIFPAGPGNVPSIF